MPDPNDVDDVIDGWDRDALLAGVSPFVFTLEDQLQIDSLCSIAGAQYTVTGVMLTGDYRLRPFAFVHSPNSNRTIATSRFSIGSGWLLRLRIASTAGTPTNGQAFVWARICRGLTSVAQVNGTIVANYVTANTDLFWPGGPVSSPLDGAGALRSITGTAPAAGAEISEVVPTGARWELLAFNALLTAGAAVASRFPNLAIDDGANIFGEITSQAATTAGNTNRLSFAPGLDALTAYANSNQSLPLPIGLRLSAGFRIRTVTSNLQAADQYTAPQYLVREWLEGN